MYCKKCGREIDDQTRYCIYCGQDQQGVTQQGKAWEKESQGAKNVAKQANPFGLWGIILLIAVWIVVIVLVCFLIFRIISGSKAGRSSVGTAHVTEQETENEGATVSQNQNGGDTTTSEDQTAPEETSDVGNKFVISDQTVADYQLCLDPSEYIPYDSGNGLFRFSYPSHLYNSVEEDTEAHPVPLGNENTKNIQTVHFYASDGSEAIFQVMGRVEPGGIDPKLGTFYETENQQRLNGQGEGTLHYEDGYGYFYVSGYNNDGNVIYEYLRMDDSLIYRFLTVTPPWSDETDKTQKEYVTTCMQRLTGFSTDQSVPSYSEFQSQAEDSSSSRLSNEEIAELAKRRSGAPIAKVESVEQDGKIVIHLFEAVADEGGMGHTATWDWYTIDPETLQGEDFMGEPVDLSEYL